MISFFKSQTKETPKISCSIYDDFIKLFLIFEKEQLFLPHNELINNEIQVKNLPLNRYTSYFASEHYDNEFEYLLSKKIKQLYINHHTESLIKKSNFEDAKQIIDIVGKQYYNLYNQLKEYCFEFIEFYEQNPKLRILYDQIMDKSVIIKAFIDQIDRHDLNITFYGNSTYDYLHLIWRMLNERFAVIYEINKTTKEKTCKRKEIYTGILPFENSPNPDIHNIAKQIRSILRAGEASYNGFKCPEEIVFTPVPANKIKILVDFLLSNILTEDNDRKQLESFFQNGFIAIKYDQLQQPITKNRFILKHRRIGMLSYIFNHLKETGIITTDNLWTSLENHKVFRTVKMDEEDYIKRGQYSDYFKDFEGRMEHNQFLHKQKMDTLFANIANT